MHFIISQIRNADRGETIGGIVNGVSLILEQLQQEKNELQRFIVNITSQLGQLSELITDDFEAKTDEHRQARAATGAHVGHLIREAQQLDGRRTVAATDNAGCFAVGNCLSNHFGAFIKRR